MGNDTLGLNENELLWGRLFLATTLVERAREVELSRVNISLIQVLLAYGGFRPFGVE